jgi:hypothetical protein
MAFPPYWKRSPIWRPLSGASIFVSASRCPLFQTFKGVARAIIKAVPAVINTINNCYADPDISASDLRYRQQLGRHLGPRKTR